MSNLVKSFVASRGVWAFPLFAVLCITCAPMAVAQQTPPAAATTPTKEEILASDAWRKTLNDFKEWLSVQKIYNAQQIEEIQTNLRNQIATMSPEELLKLQSDMQARLEVLLSSEADEARTWLANFLSVQAMYSEEELQEMLPDVVNMTPAQIRQALQNLQQRRGQTQSQHASFEASRQRQIDQARRAREQQQAASERALDRASRSAAASANRNYQSPYAPRRTYTPPSRPNFYINPWGGVGRIW